MLGIFLNLNLKLFFFDLTFFKSNFIFVLSLLDREFISLIEIPFLDFLVSISI